LKFLNHSFTFLFLCTAVWAIEFSEPVEFAGSGSNLGEQQIVEVVRKWVGPTPQELAPGVVALGSLKDRKYILEDPDEVGGELVEVKSELQSQPYDLNFKDSQPSKQRPRRRPIEGWVGPLPEELAPGVIALGSMANRRFVREPYDYDQEVPGTDETEDESLLKLSAFTSARTYFTNNALRQKSDEKKSMALENALGVSMATKGISMGNYVTMVPKIDLMMQVATYENDEIKDLLGYGFGMVKAGINFELPNNYSISTGLEYNLLHSTDSGDKMFDAWAPSLRLSKMMAIGEQTLLMTDASMKYALTERVLPFEAPGVFADDGDNFQMGASLALVQLLDAQGKFMLMPRIGLTRTQYLKNEQEGRVDWMINSGLGLTWQMLDWLSMDLGAGWSALWMNAKGKELQGESSRFNAWDLGLTVLGSHTF
jgi:hypothetical protein